jgi:hypothetical protein
LAPQELKPNASPKQKSRRDIMKKLPYSGNRIEIQQQQQQGWEYTHD